MLRRCIIPPFIYYVETDPGGYYELGCYASRILGDTYLSVLVISSIRKVSIVAKFTTYNQTKNFDFLCLKACDKKVC